MAHYKISNSQEARMFNLIYDYINDLMPEEFRTEYGDPDEDGDLYYGDKPTNKTTAISVYRNDGDYSNMFRIYLPNYWNKGIDLIEKSPLISFYKPYSRELTSTFGPLWHDPFKMWFKHNFPELSDIDIKTFDLDF